MTLPELKEILKKCSEQQLEEWYLKILNNEKIDNEKRQFLLQKVMYEFMDSSKHAYMEFTYNDLFKQL